MSEHHVERRLTLRLLAYWERLRGQRPMPSEHDINPEDLAELWDHCFLVHLQAGESVQYSYSYLGAAIVEAYQGSLSGQDAGGIVTLNASRLTASYSKVANTGLPVTEDGQFNNLNGDIIKYRQCMLPLGEGGKVDAILGGMRYKVFRP